MLQSVSFWNILCRTKLLQPDILCLSDSGYWLHFNIKSRYINILMASILLLFLNLNANYSLEQLYPLKTKCGGDMKESPCLSICPYFLLVQLILNWYWCNFTQMKFRTSGCAWQRIISVPTTSRVIIQGR